MALADLSDSGRIPPAALGLGLVSLIPFALAALAQWVPLPGLAAGLPLPAGIAYGAVVLSFLGGIRWGTAIGPYATARQALELAASTLPALAAWIALLLTPVP